MNKLKIAVVLIALIQLACSKVVFQDSVSSENGKFSIQDVLLNTEHNTPISFEVKIEGNDSVQAISFNQDKPSLFIETVNGKLELLNFSKKLFKYTPHFGFRGKEEFSVFAKNNLNKMITGSVTVIVGNPIYQMQPSIATRGPACVACHLKSSSNFITDFGLKGIGDYKDFTFGGDQWTSGSPYGDHGASINTIQFMNAEAKVIVPKAELPAPVKAETGLNTFAEYFKMRLQEPDNAEKEANPYTKNTVVEEKNSIYIGAPTVEELRSDFSMKLGDQKYFKDNQNSPALMGIEKDGTLFKNLGKVICDGDLALDGTLFLRDLHIETMEGCRIYVTGSVFIYGAITYENKTKDSNLQISSARGIFLGLGDIMNADRSEPCEKEGWYRDRFAASSYNNFMTYYGSTLKHRVKTLWTLPYTPLRLGKTLAELGGEYMSEVEAVEAKVGQLKDVTCYGSREVSFERLLLNAPQVQSRYYGAFKGSIIAEYVLMSLSRFNFTYDPVFSSNTVLPMISRDNILSIK